MSPLSSRRRSAGSSRRLAIESLESRKLLAYGDGFRDLLEIDNRSPHVPFVHITESPEPNGQQADSTGLTSSTDHAILIHGSTNGYNLDNFVFSASKGDYVTIFSPMRGPVDHLKMWINDVYVPPNPVNNSSTFGTVYAFRAPYDGNFLFGVGPSHWGSYTLGLAIVPNRNVVAAIGGASTTSVNTPITLSSQSYDPEERELSFRGDIAIGTGISKLQWSGGGPTYTFAQPGTYSVTLTATSNDGETATATHDIVVSAPPVLPKLRVENAQQLMVDHVKVATLIDSPNILTPTGSPTPKFNKLDGERFFVILDDPTIAPGTAFLDGVSLESVGRNGTSTIDSLAQLRLYRQANGTFASQPLILVADAQDDTFGGNEGTQFDVTIQAHVGGTLKLRYANATPRQTEATINVSHPQDIRKIVLNVTYLNGGAHTPQSISDMIGRADKLFAQINTFLEVKQATAISDPGGLADLEEFQQPEQFDDTDSNGVFTFSDLNGNREHDPGEQSEPFTDRNGNLVFDGLEMTAEERALLVLNRDPNPAVVNVYFVDSLTDASGNPGSSAEAFPPGVAGNVVSGFQTVDDAALVHSLVVTASSNFKTLAHELLHLLLNDGGHSSDIRRVMFGTFEPDATVAKKRISSVEGVVAHSSVLAQALQGTPIVATLAATAILPALPEASAQLTLVHATAAVAARSWLDASPVSKAMAKTDGIDRGRRDIDAQTLSAIDSLMATISPESRRGGPFRLNSVQGLKAIAKGATRLKHV